MTIKQKLEELRLKWRQFPELRGKIMEQVEFLKSEAAQMRFMGRIAYDSEALANQEETVDKTDPKKNEAVIEANANSQTDSQDPYEVARGLFYGGPTQAR